MRSFTNVWYWIAVAVLWTWLGHHVLGVPHDMVARARREGGAALDDLEAVVAAQVNRRLRMMAALGHWLVGGLAFGLTALALLGFAYGLQLGQALFLLLLPATLVGAMGLASARRLARDRLAGEALCAYLARQRFRVQLLGMVSILATTLWAALQILTMSVLGGA